MRPETSHKIIKSVSDTIKNRNLFDLNEKILVGISGGKDSLALLDCLFSLGYKNLHSIHIKLDKDSPLPFENLCRERSEFTVIDTDILKQLKESKRSNKCYMCSREKRKILSRFSVENGFRRLALAHHRDDVIETMLLNLLFQREISTMMPAQELFDGRLYIVRPFYDTSEKEIRSYAKTKNLPITDWQCGFENDTRRAWIKQQIKDWQRAFPKQKIVDNIFAALQYVNKDFLP
jgi:tRNA 2-thiocytidine biosynthesis protein TtcA